jgi:hypothetical protein
VTEWFTGQRSGADHTYKISNVVAGTYTDRVTVTAGGLVGIGTGDTSPTAPLSVRQPGAGYSSQATNKGTIQIAAGPSVLDAGGGLEFLSSTFGSGYGWKITATDNAGSQLIFGSRQNSASWTEAMRIDGSGNVGIGITNPQQLLALGNSTDQVGAGVSGAVSTVYFGSPSNISGGIKRIAYDRASGSMNFIGGTVASPSTQMTLDSNGALGIGTPTPGVKLEVVQNQATYSYFDFYNTTANGGVVFRQIYRNIANTGNATVDFAKLIGGGFALNNTDTNAANFTSFGVGASERMRITSAGDVGIGTSSPGSRLDVGAGGNLLLSGASTGDQFIKVGSGRSGNGFSYIDIQGDTTYSNGLRLIRTNGGANTSSNIEHRGTGELQLITQEAGAITFLTTATERMRITSAGDVGIGTTSPGNKLTVNGDASFGSSIYTGTGASTGDCKIELGSERSAAGNAYIDFHALAGQDYNGRIIRLSGTNGSFEITNAGTGAMTFSTNNGERMRIDGSGAFLVGTTGGNVGYGGGAGFTVEPTGQMHNAVSGSTDCYYMQKDNTGGAYLKFFYGALNSPPSVVGDITTNGTGTSYNTSSDYRLKDINGPIANSGAYIDALKPVQGSWKADGSRFIGLLAHEVQEVSETPIATGEKDGEEMQAMDYSAPELIANLIAEVQSLRARVAQLEGN